jgi:serine/threonine protein kinase
VDFGPYRTVDDRAPGEVDRHPGFHIKTGKRALLRLIGEHGIGDQINHALALAGKTLPHVEPVLEVGPRENGAWVAYADDGSLDLPTLLVRADDPPSLPPIAAAVALGVLQGLEALHAHSLVHGALCPAAIRVTKDATVVVTDVGRRSSTGRLVGDLRCLSPEQIAGGAPDPRSDLFALGAVLYAIAAGRAPFEGPTAMATVRRVAEVEYRRLSEVVLNAPFALSDLVDAVLRKDPAARIATARDAIERTRALEADARRGRELLRELVEKGSLVPKHMTTTAPHLAPLLAPEVETPGRARVVTAHVPIPAMRVPPKFDPPSIERIPPAFRAAPPVSSDPPKREVWEEGPTHAFEPVHAAPAAPPHAAPQHAIAAHAPPPQRHPVATPPIVRLEPVSSAAQARARKVDGDGLPVWVVPVVFGGLLLLILLSIVVAALVL